MHKLTLQECHKLAKLLGDTPTTVIPISRLEQGTCDAYIADQLPDFAAAILFDPYCQDEPYGFGTDADKMRQLLKSFQAWSCINVNATIAEPLAKLIQTDFKIPVKLYADIYHTLLEPVNQYHNKDVRRLTIDDATILSNAPTEVQGNGYPNLLSMLSTGIAAGSIVDGKIVAIAHTYAETNLYVDIGVSTVEKWHNKGFATAAASLVAHEIQSNGKIPVWSCGEDNFASLKVAHKLGFTVVDRRIYVIPTSAQ